MWRINLKKKKKNLREACREEYGDEFIKKYDALNSGEPIGDICETLTFITMVERVKQKIAKIS